jgi:hypothetical protein
MFAAATMQMTPAANCIQRNEAEADDTSRPTDLSETALMELPST